MTPNERAGLLGEMSRTLGIPVGDVRLRRVIPGELPGPVPVWPSRRKELWVVLAHPASDSWCGCHHEVRGRPHASVCHVGPLGAVRNPRSLNAAAARLGRSVDSRPLTAADGHRLAQLVRRFTEGDH